MLRIILTLKILDQNQDHTQQLLIRKGHRLDLEIKVFN